ncbi:MAG: polysaccharide deacetylase family protein [Acidobacteriota bacterium]
MKLPVLILFLGVPLIWGQETPRTEITKWQDGKAAAVSITFDDSTINHFRIAIPLLNERGFPGTFFVVTNSIQGSKNKPGFAGRPVMDIIRESEKVPTNKDNLFERLSLLNYLRTVQHVDELNGFDATRLGRRLDEKDYAGLSKIADENLANLRRSGKTYEVKPPTGPVGDKRYPVTWDELRRYAAQGHEMANHTASHPFMPAQDEANISAELLAAKEDFLEQLGPKETFSVEAPYGIDDERIRPAVSKNFQITRNWVQDPFMDGIMRGDPKDPAESKKEYLQWQRGPLSRTTLETMKGWVDQSILHGVWLVLVFHGIEGIGWEQLPTETIRAYWDYIYDHKGQLWVATYRDGAKYARERMSSKVTPERDGEAIRVTVKHSLDPKIYDLPLTAKTVIPSDWRIVRFQQGNDLRWLPVYREGGRTFVQYRLAADGTPARLEKGLN